MAERDVNYIAPPELVEDARNPNHPAHDWFTWDVEKAAYKTLLQEAREFLHIQIVPSNKGALREDNVVYVPAYVAPGARVQSGESKVYYSFEDSRSELIHQMIEGGYSWPAMLKRYRGVMSPDLVAQAETFIAAVRAYVEAETA